jgi:hypothetical protein
MRNLPTPAVRGPQLVADADPICSSAADIWIALGPGQKLRGVCSEAGAYNTAFRFFVIDEGGGRTTPLRFRVPWRRTSDDDRLLVNPVLSRDGLRLSGFAKGIGLGTCGQTSDWAWTGHAFQLVRFAEMRDCRGGVLTDSWPVVYQARLVP